MKKFLLCLLLLAGSVKLAVAQGSPYAAYVNPGTGWEEWNAALGSQTLPFTPPPVQANLYCNAGSGWQPCNPSGLTGTACTINFSSALHTGLCVANAYGGGFIYAAAGVGGGGSQTFGLTAGTTDLVGICF